MPLANVRPKGAVPPARPPLLKIRLTIAWP